MPSKKVEYLECDGYRNHVDGWGGDFRDQCGSLDTQRVKSLENASDSGW